LQVTMLRYIGEDERVYPQIVIPGEGSLVAHAGDVRDLDENPGDGRWVDASPPKPSFIPATPATPAAED
jgi:hypothetical protein